jgi:hypothetical protein
MHPLTAYLVDNAGNPFLLPTFILLTAMGIAAWVVVARLWTRERRLAGAHVSTATTSDPTADTDATDTRDTKYSYVALGGVFLLAATWILFGSFEVRQADVDRANRVTDPAFSLQDVRLDGRRIEIDGVMVPDHATFTYANQPTLIEGMTVPPTEVSFRIPTTEAIRIMREMRAMGMTIPETTGTDGVQVASLMPSIR